MRPLVLSIVAMAVLTTTAVAQPSPPPGPEPTARNLWSVSAGYEVFALRDISRKRAPARCLADFMAAAPGRRCPAVTTLLATALLT